MTDTICSNLQTTRRLFFAIEPSEEVRESLADLTSRLEKAVMFTPARLAWVPAANFHVTLYFLGNTDSEKIPALESNTARLLAGSFQFQMDIRKLGLFPTDPKEPPRVLWVGAHKSPPELANVRALCADALRATGLPVPDQDFSPHVTLARIKSTKGLGPFRKQIKPHEFHKAGKFLVTHVTLMESITGGGLAHFQPVVRFPLAPKPAAPTDTEIGEPVES